MKSYRQELWFEVPSRRAFVNITPEVEECLRASGIKEGLVLVNAMHITLIKQLAAANPCAARKSSFSFLTTQSFPGSSGS